MCRHRDLSSSSVCSSWRPCFLSHDARIDLVTHTAHALLKARAHAQSRASYKRVEGGGNDVIIYDSMTLCCFIIESLLHPYLVSDPGGNYASWLVQSWSGGSYNSLVYQFRLREKKKYPERVRNLSTSKIHRNLHTINVSFCALLWN